MNTQVAFKMDKKLKEAAMKKAGENNITLSSFLKMAVSAFVEGQLKIGILGNEKLNKETEIELKRAQKDIKERKNLSPIFHNSKNAINYLKKQTT